MGRLSALGKPGGWVLAYALGGALMTGTYAYAAATGWEFGSDKGEIPAEVRHSQHGYRTYSYWHRHHYWHSPRIFFWSTGSRGGYRWGK